MYYAIYAIVDDLGTPVYVGSTNNVKRRMKEHQRTLKYKPKFKILEEGQEKRFLAEEKWIHKLRADGFMLRNKADFFGGRQVHCESTKRLLSDLGKGRMHTPEARQKISDALKGRPHDWTAEGEKNASKTHFVKGTYLLSKESEQKRRKSLRKHWSNISKEKKSQILTTTNLKAWANRTDEQRSAIGKKIAATRLKNHTPEQLSEIAKRNGCAIMAKHPDIGQIAKNRMQNWWANMTPEYRKEYLARRAEKIREGKARGK